MNPQMPTSSQYGSGAASFLSGPPTQLTSGNEQLAPIYSLNNVYAQQQAYNMQMQIANKVAIDNGRISGMDLVNIKGMKGLLCYYYGTPSEDLETFLNNFDAWATDNAMDEKKKALYLRYALRGEAYKWWESAGAAIQRSNKGDVWARILESINARFNSDNARLYWKRQFNSIQQIQGEPFHDFLDRFNMTYQKTGLDLAAKPLRERLTAALTRDLRIHAFTLSESGKGEVTFENFAAKLARFDSMLNLGAVPDAVLGDYAKNNASTPHRPANILVADAKAATVTSHSESPMILQPRTVTHPNLAPIPFPLTPEVTKQNATEESFTTPMKAHQPELPQSENTVRYVEAENIEDSIRSLHNRLKRIENNTKRPKNYYQGYQDQKFTPRESHYEERRPYKKARYQEYKRQEATAPTCYRCQQVGHKSFECTNPQPQKEFHNTPRGSQRRPPPNGRSANYKPQYGNPDPTLTPQNNRAPAKLRHIQTGESQEQQP